MFDDYKDVMRSIYLDRALDEALRVVSFQTSTSKSEIVAKALERYIPERLEEYHSQPQTMIEVRKGEIIRARNGERSQALGYRCYETMSQSFKRLSDIEGLRLGGFKEPELSETRDKWTREVATNACAIFETLTGLKLPQEKIGKLMGIQK